MSCLEHGCVKCGQFVLNNELPWQMKEVPCPKCGRTVWTTILDEIPEEIEICSEGWNGD